MSIKTVKRLAAKVLGVGESRVRIADLDKAFEAVTTEDVQKLVSEGAISVRALKGNSKARARERRERRARRSRSPGRRKGTANARLSFKKRWIVKVRAQRKYLKVLEKEKKLSPSVVRKLYLMVKGNYFRSKKHMEEYVGGLKAAK